MADGHYRVTEAVQLQQPPGPQPPEIYVNKDLEKPSQWFPVNNFIGFAGATTGMYNNVTTPSYPPPGYDNSYQYQYGTSYGYQGYSYQEQQPEQQQQQPVPPGEAYQQSGWTQAQSSYPALQQQPIQPNEPNYEVVQEMQQQKATLTKQREEYVRKAMVLRRELDQLKQQKQELAGNDKPDKELRSVLKGNDRLQDEINGKLKAILNVVEMLSSIIKDGKRVADLEVELAEQEVHIKREPRTPTPIPKHETRESSRQRSRSPSKARSEKHEKELDKTERFCYVYYDTGLHWCRACDKFPETAKELLQHLHSDQHQDRAKENEVDTTPWHKLPMEELLPSFDDCPKKRIPIKGLQFFISAPSWYCKLCDVWIGDLHCASHHLKSQVHFQNYENFVKQNPHWETEWMKDRERAMTRKDKRKDDSSDSDGGHKKKKHRRHSSNESTAKDKKKKKRSKKKKKESSDSSSSSSSSSESSSEDEESKEKANRGKSIRVAMRNMQQVKSIMDEDMSKWSVLEKLMEDVRKKEGEIRERANARDREDELISQWMTIANPVPEKEKNLLESLKDRMRAKQDLEKAKMAELELRRREKEREEQEIIERKRRQMEEEAERAERERKRKEQELNKVLDKDRSHVRFRAAREHFRKRRSFSDEEEIDNNRGNNRERIYKKESRENTPEFRPRKIVEPVHKAASPELQKEHDELLFVKRKPPGPPSYKKLPFIGRMPLFKKKMEQKAVEKDKEVSKEEYEPSRKTRFESGNLTKAYIPKPELVCFPMLSTVPPMVAPPEPTAVEKVTLPVPPVQQKHPKYLKAPDPPVIRQKAVPAPPAPTIVEKVANNYNMNMNAGHVITTYYEMFQPTKNDNMNHPPLEPPPLPPDDDLAMLGICADDMAAQSF